MKVFFLPAKEQLSNKPFVILISGGAYTCVCSIVESFPTAALLDERYIPVMLELIEQISEYFKSN